MDKNFLKKAGHPNPGFVPVQENLRKNLKMFRNLFYFVQNFFKTKYFCIISFLLERSRAVDAKNGQTLDLTPSGHRDIVGQRVKREHVHADRKVLIKAHNH